MARTDSAAGKELYRRLQLSFLLRVILVTFLLGATAVIQFSKYSSFITTPLLALYLLSGITYFITLVSVIALRWRRFLKSLAYLQIVWEVVFVTALIYVTTAGIESIFSFLYLVAIIMAGILQYRKGAFMAAAMGSVCYGLLLSGMEMGAIPPLLDYNPMGWNNLIFNVFINLAAMFGMAVLSSYLTEKLRVTGNELQATMRHRDALEALNDNIVRSLSAGVVTVDLDNIITSFNHAAEKITDVPGEQALGTEICRLFPLLDDYFSSGKGTRPKKYSRHEFSYQSPKLGARHLELWLSPLLGAGEELLGTLVILNDITEIREMEARLRKSDRLAAVGQLAAGIAHEIRNPLASISGSIQVLENELNLDPTGGRLMQIVLRETERLNTLITDFLLYARPAPRNIEKVKLDRLIKDMIEVYRNRTDIASPIDWNLELQPDLEIRSDRKLLEQIFWNLVNNAVQAMPEGGDLHIRAYPNGMEKYHEKIDSDESTDRAGNAHEKAVTIEVEDTGQGINPEIIEKIFDPFFTTKESGTGLGLSTVYRLVEAMEGSVYVERGRNRGARFFVTIPVDLEENFESGAQNQYDPDVLKTSRQN